MENKIDLLLAFFISMLPIVELRGGIIFAAARGIPFVAAFAVCYLGNIIPVPFILFFIRKVFEIMEKFKFTGKIVKKVKSIAHGKSDKIRKYQLLGLFMFTAIPLPGTGAWMGALISVLMELPIKKTFPVIAVGVLSAGIIMSILSYLIPGFFFSVAK